MQIPLVTFISLGLAHTFVAQACYSAGDTNCRPPGGASIFVGHPARPEYEFHIAPCWKSTYPHQLKSGLLKQGFELIPAAQYASGEDKDADLDGRYCGWAGWAEVSEAMVDRGYISWRMPQMPQLEIDASATGLEQNRTTTDSHASDAQRKTLELNALLRKVHGVLTETYPVEMCIILAFSLWPVYIPLLLIVGVILFGLGKLLLQLVTRMFVAVARGFSNIKRSWRKRPAHEGTETELVSPNVANALVEIRNRNGTQHVPRSPPPAWSERDLPIYEGFNNQGMEGREDPSEWWRRVRASRHRQDGHGNLEV